RLSDANLLTMRNFGHQSLRRVRAAISASGNPFDKVEAARRLHVEVATLRDQNEQLRLENQRLLVDNAELSHECDQCQAKLTEVWAEVAELRVIRERQLEQNEALLEGHERLQAEIERLRAALTEIMQGARSVDYAIHVARVALAGHKEC